MRKITSVRPFLGATVAIAAIAAGAPASAQQIDEIVVFGDSYADTGNAFALGYANPQAQIIYRTGRFSGGTNYIDTLANLLGVPVDNYAIGGALASMNNSLICFDPIYGAPLCGKGFQYEVGQYLATSPGTLDESTLLTFSIGGNDARLYQQAGGPLEFAALSGAGTAQLANAGISQIIGSGTPTISFLAGDTGRLPEIAGDPAGAAIRTAYSAAFNQTMQQFLAGYAANGSVVHYLDLDTILDNVIANPQAYGITKGIACPAVPNLACVGDSSGYLFYADGLHLTSQGFSIVGQYVATQVDGPLTLSAPSSLGVDLGRQFGRTLTSRMAVGAPGTDVPEGARVFAILDGMTVNHGATRGNAAYQNEGLGGTIGAEFAFAGGRAGIAANYSKPQANFGGDQAEVDTSSVQLGGYAGGNFGSGYVQGFLTYGWDKHDIDRRGVVEGMEAKPDGNHWSAGVKAGATMMGSGNWGIGPVVALDYARAKVDGYTESGDPALTLDVSSTRAKSLRGNLGVEMRGDLGSDGAGLRPYASAMLEKEFSNRVGSATFFQTDTPVIVNNFSFEPASKRIYGRFNVGGKANVGNLMIDAGVSLTAARKHGQETSGQVAVSFAF